MIKLLTLLLLIYSPPVFGAAEKTPVEIKTASKKFTESVILGEIITQIARTGGARATHRSQLGGTRILWSSLISGEIDIYPEYTGTIAKEIFSGRSIKDERQLREALAEHGILMSRPLGFNNTYVLGMKEDVAVSLGIEKISDLQNHPGLKLAFSNEFMDRGDGWPGLRSHYGLPQKDVRGLDHDLAYRGLQTGSIDAMDLYSTDAEISYYNIRRLHDDLNYFPRYDAVILYRKELLKSAPEILGQILELEGRIDEPKMVGLNAQAKLHRIPEQNIAAGFLSEHLSLSPAVSSATFLSRLWRRTMEHLFLVAISLSAAIVISIPLGILSRRHKSFGQVILGAVGIIQTVPSLALLVFMIPLLGIGTSPAIAALFLYSLLPIVRNTYAGLSDIPPEITESSMALGLPEGARLRLVELPLASRSILAGIKTSSVINVGTATLGALIGAGGYGQPILTGIRLDNTGLILEGAVPAALLALAVQGLFEVFERTLLPKGLLLKPE